MPSSNEREDLKPDERRFIRRMAEHYAPQPLSAAQRATFDRTLEKRLVDSSRSPFLRPAGILIPVCAALLLWFALPSQQASSPNFKALTPPPAPTPFARDLSVTGLSDRQATTPHPTLLAYAYYQSEMETDFLPAEYIALADAFELL